MRFSLFLILTAGLLAAADFYNLPDTKKVEQDLYRSGSLYIETRYCYHYTYGEQAVLRYEGTGEYSGSKIIWADDSSCDVKSLFKR